MKKKRKNKNKQRILAAAISSSLIANSVVGTALASTTDKELNSIQVTSEESINSQNSLEDNNTLENTNNVNESNIENKETTPESTSPKEETNTNVDENKDNIEEGKESQETQEPQNTNTENKEDNTNKEEENKNEITNNNKENIDSEEKKEIVPPTILSTRQTVEASEMTRNATIVNIPDVNLKKALNFKLGKGEVTTDITQGEMQNLPLHLDLKNKGITDLTGLNAAIKLQVIYLDNNNIQTIKQSDFAEMNNLIRIDLNNCNISSIEKGSFNILPEIFRVYLANNKLTKVEEGVFGNCPKMDTIDLSNNQISVIEDNSFSGCSKLKQLILSNNKIARINVNTFGNLPMLSQVILTNNLITFIEENSFNGLPSASACYLNNNKLTTIKSDTFNGLSSVVYITLDNNEITTVESNAFNSLNNLLTIIISNNKIENLSNRAFSNLPKFNRLYIMDNKLTSINKDAFLNVPIIKEFVATNNQISSISRENFENIRTIKQLGLSGNKINNIPSDVFVDLSELNTLDLSKNGIISINTNIFSSLVKLTELNLNENRLTSIEEGMFNGLNSIVNLMLEKNQISSIHPNSFKGLSTVNYIALTYNKIKSLDNTTFSGLPKLSSISLYSNELTEFPTGLYSNIPSLKHINLSFNKIKAINKDDLKGISTLTRIRITDNEISYIDKDAYIDLVNLDEVNLANNKLTTLDSELFKNATKLTKLFISGNSLTDLSAFLKYDFQIDATNQKYIHGTPIQGNRLNMFTIDVNMLSNIKGFATPLSTLNPDMVTGANNVNVSNNGTLATFKVEFPEGVSSNKVSIVYPLSGTKPNHTYSVNAEFTVEENVTLFNTINTILNKEIDSLNLEDGKNLIKINNKVNSMDDASKGEVIAACPLYTEKMPSYLQRGEKLVDISNISSVDPSSKDGIYNVIKKINEISTSQSVELKDSINKTFVVYLSLIEKDLEKYPVDKVTPNDKIAVEGIKTEYTHIQSNINNVIAKDTSIIIEDTINKSNSVNKTINDILTKIVQIEDENKLVAELTENIGKYINRDASTLTVEESQNLNNINAKLYSSSESVQKRVIEALPGFNEKMPPLFERSKLIIDIKKSSSGSQSYETLGGLINKTPLLSQMQALQLSSEINLMVSNYINLFSKDIEKFTLDNIQISNKDEINKLTQGLNELEGNILAINKLAGNNIILDSSSKNVKALLGTLEALSTKIQSLEENAAVVNAMVEEISNWLSRPVNEITLEESRGIINTDKKFKSLPSERQKDILAKIPDYESKMQPLLQRAIFLTDVKEFTAFETLSSTKLDALVEEFKNLGYEQKLELKADINATISAKSIKIEKEINNYSIENITSANKEDIKSIKENLLKLKADLEKLITSIKAINSTNVASLNYLLAKSEFILSDVSTREISPEKIVNIETEEKILAMHKSVNAMLNKITEIENTVITDPVKPDVTNPNGGSTSTSTNKDNLAQTGAPLASLILTMGSASLLGGGYILLKRRRK